MTRIVLYLLFDDTSMIDNIHRYIDPQEFFCLFVLFCTLVDFHVVIKSLHIAHFMVL